jgi:hypothetical protein
MLIGMGGAKRLTTSKIGRISFQRAHGHAQVLQFFSHSLNYSNYAEGEETTIAFIGRYGN